jgi:hypothetical protein
VRGVGIVEKHDANALYYPTRLVDPVAEVVSLTRSPKSRPRLMLLLKTLKPRSSADNKYARRLERTIAAPFVPTIVWPGRMDVQIELVEDNVDASNPKLLGEGADTLSLRLIGLSVADKHLGHSVSTIGSASLPAPLGRVED